MGGRRDPWFVEASPYNPKSYGAYPEYEFHFVRGREQNDLKFQSPNLSLPEGLSRTRLADRDGLRSLLDRQRHTMEQAATSAPAVSPAPPATFVSARAATPAPVGGAGALGAGINYLAFGAIALLLIAGIVVALRRQR